jgi:hypothetical protein
VTVRVKDGLTGLGSGVELQPERTVGQLLCHSVAQLNEVKQLKRGVLRKLNHIAVVRFWDHQNMHGLAWIDVVKGNSVLGLGDQF